MDNPPLDRQQQIKFMTEAAKRRAERHERLAVDPEFLSILRQPAESNQQGNGSGGAVTRPSGSR